MDQAAKDAYDAARKRLAETASAGKTGISFDEERFRALTHIPDEIAGIKGLTRLDLANTKISDLSALAGLTGLQYLSLDQTGVSDLSALAGLTGLQSLYLQQTGVNDLSALAGLTRLQGLYLSQTGVSDLSALAGLTGLRILYLDQTGVSDLRPLMGLEKLGDGHFGGLWFANTPAVRLDDTLARLAGIEDNTQRAKEVLAYLKTLPPWPEPLPWLQPPAPPVPEPGVPMRVGPDGIDLASKAITGAELDDPIRATLHDALQEQTHELIRVSGNMDEASYRQACKLRDLLEVGLAAMNPLLVHLAIEALRRVHAKASADADRDFVLALEAVIDTGPGLTLDTEQVQLFIDRANRNRLARLAEAEAEAQIRLARSIAESDLTAPDLKAIAQRAADEQVYDQFTAIRPTLGRNYVLEVGKFVAAAAVGGVIGNTSHGVWVANDAWSWLAANAADLRVMAGVWGEPFAAWLIPILDRAQQMVAAGKHITAKARGKR